MSTRSRIAYELPNGSIRSIYCHSDGYLEGPHGVGHMLHTYYQDRGKVHQLVDAGDRGTLTGPNSDGRVYGGTDNQTAAHPNLTSWAATYEEYNYLFSRGDKWFVTCQYGEPHEKLARELALALVTERVTS